MAMDNTTRIRTRQARRANASDVFMFGDSYLSSARRRNSNWYGYAHEESTINLLPHQTHDQLGVRTSARVRTYSRGGLKLADIANGRDRWIADARSKWANNVPAVTVFVAGACDMNNAYIANIPMQDVRRNYPDYVMGMLQDFVHKSRRAASNKNIFDARVGYEPQTDVTPQEYRQRCTRAQCGLQCSARRLWENYSASVFTSSPSFQELRGWQGNHLDGASQEDFINELLTAVRCLLCDTCTPGIEFYKVEHQRHHRIEDVCRRN